ncbi:nSTAND1 domain-containing NTPase [Lentzea sp. NPDC054927]
MTVLFISHSSRDLAQRVHDRLVAEGYGAVFLDVDPADGIAAGRDWERELYGQLRRADAVVFIGTDAAVGSRWCHAELVLARSIGKPVFPINAGATHPLLNDVQWVDLADVARLPHGLRRAGLDPQDSFAWDPARSPYPGLASFTSADAAVFFGRGNEIEHLQRLLTPTLERGANRFVAIVGPSGSGKSSLVRAGLLPRLARTPDRWLVLPPLIPGSRPLRNLARVLARDRDDVDSLAERLTPETFGDLFHDRGDASVLLFVDQAEELLRSDPVERRAFLDLLAAPDVPLWIVAALRSEFLGAAQELTTLIDDPVLLEPLDRSRLAEVIERPATRAGIFFQEGLVSRIVADTAGGDALPMLAYTLRELWERTSPGDTLGHEHYQAVGGVAGALRRQAERLTADLRGQGRADAVVPTLMRLVDVDAEGTLTRRRLPLAALNPVEAEVVRAFVDARLLTTSESTVDVVHEALIRQWPPLLEAAESRGDDLRRRSELERLALDWDRAGRPDAYLLRSERATVARDWARANPDFAPDSALVAMFLDLSARQDEAERRRLAEVLGTRILESFDEEAELRLPLALAAVEDYAPTPKALQALARALAAPRLSVRFSPPEWNVRSVDWSPDGATIVSATSMYEANPFFRVVIWDAVTGADLAGVEETDLQEARWSPDGSRIVVGRSDSSTVYDATLTTRIRKVMVHSPEWSPDGTRVAGRDPIGVLDDRVGIWDANTGRRLRTMGGKLLFWAPSGRLVVGQADHRRSKVWNAGTGALLAELDGRIPSWSPDGERILTLVEQQLAMWRVTSLRQARLMRVHDNRPESQVNLRGNVYSRPMWSPDGSRIAVGMGHGVVRVLTTADFTRGDALVVGPAASRALVEDIRWSPDATRLVLLAGDVAHVWHLGGPDHDNRLGAHATGTAWSGDGTRLLTWYRTTTTVWDPATAVALMTLESEGADVVTAIWSPDWTRVLTATSGGVQIWDVERGTLMTSLPVEVTDSGSTLSWAPTGDRVATCGGRAVRVWDAVSGAELLTLEHEVGVWTFEWSPDGTRLLTGAAQARVWDATTGAELLCFGYSVTYVSWSPDGAWILTTRDAGIIRYDATTGTQVGRLRPKHRFLKAHAWSPDSRKVVVEDGRNAAVWDITTGTTEALEGHDATLVSAEWSPDGTRILTGANDGTARIWDAAGGAELGCLAIQGQAAMRAAWSPDGTRIATCAEDSVRLWSADQPGELVAMARQAVARELTSEERRRFGLPIPLRPPRPETA